MKTFFFTISLLASSVAQVAVKPEATVDKDSELALYYDVDESEAEAVQEAEEFIEEAPRISTQRKNAWRKNHNNMRSKYLPQFGGSYRGLRWNKGLEDEAHAWATKIVETCVNKAPGSKANPSNWGVNSAVRGGTTEFISPSKIMQLWENKLDKGYPKNQVMTQVLWYGTKFIGCSDVASPANQTKTCTASVCYYGKAGNCLFRKFENNWTRAVIEAPGCSSVCPPGVNNC